ncbi:MAG: fumarate reductase/succinate dehydrogenase flavoprotein subunit [Candidatus Omnitrophica bacterium]|nr:fumarate reductase/succinate dehydrogenase flavoprotein subunit [Candidatus Omnitrophota bacterium]
MLDAKIPSGPLKDKWSSHKLHLQLVNPANKRKYQVIVVGTGLAGSSAAATLAELGYRVKVFCIQDSARRAHSISAQGGINAAKNYANDGDSIERLFYDTIKGGDFRAREANVHRLAEVSNAIIDHCVAQGVPFAREYSGYLDNRSFGGAQVSRTFYARGQTGQQLLLGAYSALRKEVERDNVEIRHRTEMLDLVTIDGVAKGIIIRDLITGKIESHSADVVIMATGGYSSIFYLSTNAKACNATAIWRAHKRGAFMANPCYTQIHPTCIPVHGEYQSKLTLMSEGLRNDGRVWVPKQAGDKRLPSEIPEEGRDYFLERKYPTFGNLVPRDIASRSVKELCDAGQGVGDTGMAVYLDLSAAIERLGKEKIAERYSNLFEMYEKISGHNPYEYPMMIYPAPHYTMGGLWVDYNLMSTIPGLFVLGEANFSDHGANRLGASALMQGLADGYFIIPYTVGDYLAQITPINTDITTFAAFKEAEGQVVQKVSRLVSAKGKRTADDFHKQLGKLLWDKCGMARTEAGLHEALDKIPEIRSEFWDNINVPGSGEDLNQSLEKAGRVADYLEFAELFVRDALHRKESCGGHFRTEYQTPEGEAKRDDEKFCYVAAWEHIEGQNEQQLHKEALKFESVNLTQRSYK